jgi:hypothetical protein
MVGGSFELDVDVRVCLRSRGAYAMVCIVRCVVVVPLTRIRSRGTRHVASFYVCMSSRFAPIVNILKCKGHVNQGHSESEKAFGMSLPL